MSMRIGVDISQLVYEKTGVAKYLKSLVEELLRIDKKNEYILFFSSFRGNLPKISVNGSKVVIKRFKFPSMFLDLLWNKLHIFPIEKFIGNVDIFITSDWTEPPAKARKATILYDLIIYKKPEETTRKIVEVQKRKLKWVRKESSMIFCISQSTKKDATDLLGVPTEKLEVIYPGI